MACWVAPAVAADLWNVPVGRVMEMIREGEVASKRDCDFLLVDVAPDSPQMAPPQPRVVTPAARPTFVAAAADEEAEVGEEFEEFEPVSEGEGEAPSWESVREQVGRRRVMRGRRAA